MTAAPSIGRLLLLPLIALAVALALHGALAAFGVRPDNPLRLLATPLIGALIVYLGMWPYPAAGTAAGGGYGSGGLILVALLV